MAKKRIEKPQREMTKHQLASWEKRQKRQRLIFLIGAAIIVAVVGLLGVGWFISDFLPMQETVIVVNDREFKMSYYVDAVEYYSETQSSTTAFYLLSYIEESISLNMLVTEAAAELGITVSDDEVKEELKSRELANNRASRDIIRAELVGNRLYDEYFDEQVPLSDEQRHVMAMLLESQSQAEEVMGKIKGGQDFGELAAELSLDDSTQEASGDLDWQPASILPDLLGTSVVEDYAFSAEAGELSPPLADEAVYKNIGYWLIEVLERDEEMTAADVQVMLLSSQEEAETVAGKLKAGGDFAELAQEYSQDDSSEDGGTIEGLEPETLTTAANDFIFNSETALGVLSEPILDEEVYTSGGYWLVKVLEIEEDRELAEDARDTLKTRLVNEWVTSLQDDPDNQIESFLDDELRYWAYYRVVD